MKTCIYHITAIYTCIVLQTTIHAHPIVSKHITGESKKTENATTIFSDSKKHPAENIIVANKVDGYFSLEKNRYTQFYYPLHKNYQGFISGKFYSLNDAVKTGNDSLRSGDTASNKHGLINADANRKMDAEMNLKIKQSNYEDAQNIFRNKGYINNNLGRKDFADKLEFKKYNEALSEVKKAQKELNAANKELIAATNAFQHSQEAINIIRLVDPDVFNKINALSYSDKSGEIHKLDVIVSSGSFVSTLKKGETYFRINATSGAITGNELNIVIDINALATSNTLAHELGHCITIAANPLIYYQAYLALGETDFYDCQDPRNENTLISKNALTIQRDFDSRLKKIIASGKSNILVASESYDNVNNLKKDKNY